MDLFKAVTSYCVCAAILFFAAAASLRTEADGSAVNEAVSVMTELGTFDFGKCSSAAIYECSTGTLLDSVGCDKAVPIGHLTKLMTYLLAVESIESGSLSLDDKATASRNAFDAGGASIWLNVGEKVTVSELLKGISIGNANDAAITLAEKIGEKAESFTELMNSRTKSIGLKQTAFTDVTGLGSTNVGTAEDMCTLCSELVKHKDFIGNFSVWMDTVRDGKAELVSRNRLIRSYKGIKGFKVCYTEESGYCAALCAERGSMTLCLTILGAEDEDELLSRCSKLLDAAFANYSVYTPEVPEEALALVPVIHGQSSECAVCVPYLKSIVLRKSRIGGIKCTFERAENTDAPVFKGQPLGKITFSEGDDEVISADICASEKVDEVDVWFSFKRILFNLLNF